MPALALVRALATALVTVSLWPTWPILEPARLIDIQAGPPVAVVTLALEGNCAILDLVPKSCPVAVD
jgi:hypothetical protein